MTTKRDKVEWREPNPGRRGLHAPIWIQRLTPCMERPGEWAVVYHYPNRTTAYNVAGQLRRGRPEPGMGGNRIPPGKWEFAAGIAADGGGEVFARYIGPE